MKSMQKGFTLIELMIVVAIIGILAAIAIPAYQDYTIRAQVSEGLTLAGPVETAVADYYANHGAYPTGLVGSTSGLLGFAAAPSGKYVSSVSWANSAITISFGNQVNATISGQTLGIGVGTSANGDLIWVCGAASAPSGVTVTGNSWSSAVKYLPAACKP